MKTSALIAHMLVRFIGAIMVVLGLLFWTGNALSLIPIHLLLGLVFVLSLWTLAFLAGRAGVHAGLVALALVWGLFVPILGIMQGRLLPGSAHWLIQLLHLLVGVGAIGLGERLAAAIDRVRGLALQP